MKVEWNKQYTTIAVYASLVLMIAVGFHFVLNNFTTVAGQVSGFIRPVMPIVFGFVLAYLLNPVMIFVEGLLMKIKGMKKVKSSVIRGASLVLTYILAALVLFLFLLIVLPEVVSNIATMYGQLQSYVSGAERFANEVLESLPVELLPQEYIDQLTTLAGDSIQRLINWLANSAPMLFSIAWQVGSGVIAVFVALVVSIYLLFAKERFIAQARKILCAFLPQKRVYYIVKVTRTANMMFGRFITGKIVDSIIIGVLCFVGLSIMQMPNAVLVSFIVGVTNVLPYFGPFVGAVPGFILIAIISPVQGFIFLVFILVLQQVDGNIIGPMILGDSTGLSAFWVVFAILLFGGIFGIWGMFIGVPTFGVIYALFKDSITARLQKRGLPSDTNSYTNPIDIDK